MMRVLLVSTALLAAGGAGWLALGVTSSPASAPATEPVIVEQKVEMADILVTAAAIPQGKALAAGDLRWQQWPADAVPSGFVNRAAEPEAMAELAGFIARGDLMEGEPVVREKLVSEDASFMSALLADGTRAVAVRVSAANAAGGFIEPQDFVDVLHTTSCAPGDGCASGSKTQTILHHVQVLAIGDNATLALTPPEAELVVGAEASGSLSLALRPIGELAGERQAAPAPAAPETGTVRVRRGTAVETVAVQ